MFTACGFVRRVESKRDQGVDVRSGPEEHGAPASPVAPVRAATWRRFLVAKTEAPTTPVPGGCADVDFVDEHACGYCPRVPGIFVWTTRQAAER